MSDDARTIDFANADTRLAFGKSHLNFVPQKGSKVVERTLPFWEWTETRRRLGVLPFNRVTLSPPAHETAVADEFGGNVSQCINFGSQDYLGLARDQRIFAAAKRVVDEFGVHSAGSPVLAGRTRQTVDLERRLAKLLNHETCMLFATGWAAGFGVVAGLARPHDTILVDRLAHNCLAEGARHASQDVKHFSHNDLENLRDTMAEARRSNATNGLFVVVESLYSMDSDSPDLNAVLRLVRQYDAILILDVAHDFGSMGARGLGLLEMADGDWPDVIMGSFSKTFASNGGFVAAAACVTNYLRYNASPMTFSNAISPLQTAIADRAADIVFSDEGQELRRRLDGNVSLLRSEMIQHGLTVSGTASPIVPVFVGDERMARLTSYHLQANGLLANLVEFPAVAKGAARFRFQVMSTHLAPAIKKAAEIIAFSRQKAQEELCAGRSSRSES